MHISVIGLGKLGCPLAAVLASKGHAVIGVDANPRSVQLLNAGRPPVFEPGLDRLIQSSRRRLSATTCCEDAIATTEVTFVVVPTPSGADGAFSLDCVLAATESIGEALRHKDAFHLVVLTSTVMPGATGGQVLALLERCSGKRCGIDIGLCYNPEFVALGNVISDMLHPDLILIGESDACSGEMLAALHKSVCDNDPPVVRMSFINAELTKLAINTFVTMKISYANALAEICERLPGAHVDVVTSAMGLDGRIGSKCLKGALGYGGTCFPRDNAAFAYVARQIGAQATLLEATDDVNRRQVVRLADLILRYLPEDGKVGILGLAYKPNTNVIEQAQGIELAAYLSSRGISVVAYDPAAVENARGGLDGHVSLTTSLAECTRQADVVVIATPCDEFKNLPPDVLNHSNGRPTVVDCWRILRREQYERVVNYVAVGVGPRPGASG